jgi:hypothetical protein
MRTRLLRLLDSERVRRQRPETESGNVTNIDILPAVSTKHPTFVIITALAFAFLYAELIVFIPLYYNRLTLENSTVWLVAGGVFALIGISVWASFSLPHRLYFPRIKRYSPIIFLMREWAVGAIILIVASLISIGAGIYLIGGNLEAIAEMIRAFGLYALVLNVLFHGMVLFARYVRYLYDRNLDQSYKVVSVAGGAALVVLVMSIYLFSQDFSRMASASGTADAGLLMLHLSLRGIFLLSICIYCIAWLFSVLADH